MEMYKCTNTHFQLLYQKLIALCQSPLLRVIKSFVARDCTALPSLLLGWWIMTDTYQPAFGNVIEERHQQGVQRYAFFAGQVLQLLYNKWFRS